MKHLKLIENFNQFQASHSACREVFCTTCGGLAFTVERHMTDQLKNDIKLVLAEISVEDFIRMGQWGWFLQRTNPIEVRAVFERKAKDIDISDIQQLDRFLFCAREFMRGSPVYINLLERGVKVAVETSNESLIETLAIILGEEILNYKQLFCVAMKKLKSNKNIHRVLYNTLRKKIPEVRGFIGDGSTSYYW